jgi:hypothetical protein
LHQNYATHPRRPRRTTDNSNALDAFMTTKLQVDAMLERLKA